MTTYYGNKWYLNAANVQTAYPAKFLPGADGVNILGIYTLGGSFALGDIVNLVPIGTAPSIASATPTVIGALLDVDALDTGGTPTLSFDVGTIGSAAAFFSQSTTCRAGGYATPTIAGVLGFTGFASPDIVAVKIHTGAQTGATTGKIRLLFEYTYDP